MQGPPGYPAGYPQVRPQLAPLDGPLLVRDIAAVALLLISLALPWWAPASFLGTVDAGQSVPATIFTVLAVFACATTYVLPLVFGARFSSLALLGIKGVLVSPLAVMGIIAIVQTLRSEETAGPAVAVALAGVVLTLQAADQERAAVGVWRNLTLALIAVSALVAIVLFILNLRTFGGSGSLVVLPVLTLAFSLIVVGAVVAAVMTGRHFSAGITLVGAALLATVIIESFLSGDSGFMLQMRWGSSPDFILQIMAVAALAAPALLGRIPSLAGRDGWVPATSAFVLVTAVLWGVGFLFDVIRVLVLTGNPPTAGLGLLIWLLALQVIAALGFAIAYRMLSTNLPQGRMVALIVAGLLAVASVVTWAITVDALAFAVDPLTILVFSLVLVGLVTIPPVMRATPMQTLEVPLAHGGPPAGHLYPGRPETANGPAPAFPGARPPVGPRQGPGQPISGPQPMQAPQGHAHWQPPGQRPVQQQEGGHLDSGPVPQPPNLRKESHEDDEWHPRSER